MGWRQAAKPEAAVSQWRSVCNNAAKTFQQDVLVKRKSLKYPPSIIDMLVVL
jgi:hypothetical protein